MRRPAVRRLRIRDDDGTILPITIFFMFLAIVVIVAVTAATSLYLERKRLFTLADGAALSGAEAFDLADVSVADGGVHATLTSAAVHAAAAEYLESTAHESLADLELTEAGTTDGRSATVSLAASWRPPMLSLLMPAGIRLDVTSSARAVFR